VDCKFQRHVTQGMRRAGEARVVTPDANLDAVENAFGDFPVFDIFTGYVEYGFIHCQVIMAGGND
jgi:hypothetical protein